MQSSTGGGARAESGEEEDKQGFEMLHLQMHQQQQQQLARLVSDHNSRKSLPFRMAPLSRQASTLNQESSKSGHEVNKASPEPPPRSKLSKLLPFKSSASPNRTRPSFSYFHQKRTGPSDSLAALQDLHAKRQLTGRMSSGIVGQQALQQERPMSQQLKQPCHQDEKNQRQAALLQQKSEAGYSGAYYDFGDKENAAEAESEEDSCEANADERESVALSDDFDEGTIRVNEVAQDSHAWDYFPDGGEQNKKRAGAASGEESDEQEEHLDEHECELSPGMIFDKQRRSSSMQRDFKEPMPSVSPSMKYFQRSKGGINRVSRLTAQQRLSGMNICELLRSKQADKPTFVKQSSKESQDERHGRGDNYTHSDARKQILQRLSPAGLRSERNTFYSPQQCEQRRMQFNPEGYLFSGKHKPRLTLNHSPGKNGSSFVYQNLKATQPCDIKQQQQHEDQVKNKLKIKVKTDQPYHVKNRLSVQQLPTSRLSHRSLLGSRQNSQRKVQTRGNHQAASSSLQRNCLMAYRAHGAQDDDAKNQGVGTSSPHFFNRQSSLAFTLTSSPKSRATITGTTSKQQLLQFNQQQQLKAEKKRSQKTSLIQTMQPSKNKNKKPDSKKKEARSVHKNQSGEINLPCAYGEGLERTNSPISKSLVNKNIIQIDENYFDHMRLPDTDEYQITASQQVSQNKLKHKSDQTNTRVARSKVNQSQRFGRNGSSHHLDNITEAGNDKSGGGAHQDRNGNSPSFLSFQKAATGAASVSSDKISISMVRDEYYDLGADYASSQHDDMSSNRNLISFLQRTNEKKNSLANDNNYIRSTNTTPSASILTHPSRQRSQNSASSSQQIPNETASDCSVVTPQLTTPQKPIVPRAEYTRQTSTVQAQQAKMMAANSKVGADASENEDAAAANGGGGMNWLTSIGLSVSQLFTGAPAAPEKPEQAEAAAAEGANEEQAVSEKRERGVSSNGEVPLDEENEESKSIELTNVDVRNEATRIHQGNTVRKKILFMETGVANKGNSSQFKASMRSAQSYNQIESGSESSQEKAGDKGSDWLKDRQNVISYTTSKDASFTNGNLNNINKINASQVKQRQHSSSVHEQINWTSFQNLASHLLPSATFSSKTGAMKDDETGSRALSPSAASSTNPKGSIVESQQLADEEQDKVKQSRFGMLSALFDRVTRSNTKQQAVQSDNDGVELNDEQIFQPYADDKSPMILGDRRKRMAPFGSNQNAGDGQENEPISESQQKRRLFGRPTSKTLHLSNDQRPLLSIGAQNQKQSSQAPVEEKLRQIDNIVFNQDKSHFAVIWTDGGFTKFDVATMQLIQKVNRTPYATSKDKNDNEIDAAAEITFRQMSSITVNMQSPRTSQGQQYGYQNSGYPDYQTMFEDDEEPEFELEQFKCLALQHKTNDYAATLVRDPNSIVFVHVQGDSSCSTNKRTQAAALFTSKNTITVGAQSSSISQSKHFKRKVSQQLGYRSHVKHFKEEVSHIEILPSARFTIVCLQTSIYIYKKNSRELFDIVPCSSPVISSAIYKSFEDKLVLAYLSRDDPNETVLVHDYSVNAATQMETVFTIDKPFSSGYKVGGLQLDELGQRVVVVSADGCYIYLYSLEDEEVTTEQEGQDLTAPAVATDEEQRIQEAAQAHYPATTSLCQHHKVSLKQPQQSFARSSTSCKDIYRPIQIVEGFSMQEHMCDFILLSTSSMTSHMFALKTKEELEATMLQQKDSWTFSRFLPSSFSLERSKIRLNIPEELTPAAPLAASAHDARTATNALASANEGENVYKKKIHEYPYTCFIESSGLLVVISHSGYCCKFSVELQHELPLTGDVRMSAYNSVRQSRLSPASRMRQNATSLAKADLGHSLAQLKAKDPPVRKGSPAWLRQQQSLKQQQIQQKQQPTVQIDSVTGPNLATSQLVGNPDEQNALQQSQLTAQQQTANEHLQASSQLKRAGAFSGYKQPTLRLKFKIQDFFVKIDQKAESLKRIRKREILQKRTQELRERALFISQMQNQQKRAVERRGSHQKRGQPKNKLAGLLRGASTNLSSNLL